jgi:rhodanese-related sulfurtransferase
VKRVANGFAAIAAAAASMAVLGLSPAARGGEPDSLNALVRDEARIARDLPLDRNIDAAAAYRMVTVQKVPLVDVRTVQEYQFVGHVPGAYNVPAFLWGRWDDRKKSFALDPNPEFVAQFSARFPDRNAAVVLMCRSGHRSAKAARLLVAAGYARVYQMWEGFEGIIVTEKDLPSYGKKVLDGWRTRGLPYTWDMEPALVIVK